MKKHLSIIVLTVIAALIFAGCSGTSEPKTLTSAETQSVKETEQLSSESTVQTSETQTTAAEETSVDRFAWSESEKERYKAAIDKVVLDDAENAAVMNAEIQISTPEIYDPAELKEFLENDEKFGNFIRNTLKRSPYYTGEEPDVMLPTIISYYISNYGINDVFPNFDYELAFPEKEIAWFVQTFFHIEKEQYLKYKEIESEVYDRTQLSGYHDGKYMVGDYGQPVRNNSICGVEHAEKVGDKLEIILYLHDNIDPMIPSKFYPWPTSKEELDPASIKLEKIVVDRINIAGNDYWTIYSYEPVD